MNEKCNALSSGAHEQCGQGDCMDWYVSYKEAGHTPREWAIGYACRPCWDHYGSELPQETTVRTSGKPVERRLKGNLAQDLTGHALLKQEIAILELQLQAERDCNRNIVREYSEHSAVASAPSIKRGPQVCIDQDWD